MADNDDETFEDIRNLAGAGQMANDESLPEEWRDAAQQLAEEAAERLRNGQ